jgi:hypothetical protein
MWSNMAPDSAYDDTIDRAHEGEKSEESRGMEIVVTGEEFGKISLANSKKKKKFRLTMQKWYRDNLQGDHAENRILGEIGFTGIGGHELRYETKNYDKYFLLPYLKQLIETSDDVQQNVDLHDDTKLNGYAERGYKIHYINNSFMRNGLLYSVKIVVLEDKTGKKYYALGIPKLDGQKKKPRTA